jgi:hypothetical protein
MLKREREREREEKKIEFEFEFDVLFSNGGGFDFCLMYKKILFC